MFCVSGTWLKTDINTYLASASFLPSSSVLQRMLSPKPEHLTRSSLLAYCFRLTIKRLEKTLSKFVIFPFISKWFEKEKTLKELLTLLFGLWPCVSYQRCGLWLPVTDGLVVCYSLLIVKSMWFYFTGFDSSALH